MNELLAGLDRRQAATIRLTEIDDIHLPSCTTPSAGVGRGRVGARRGERHFDPDHGGAIWAGTEVVTRIGQAVQRPGHSLSRRLAELLCGAVRGAATAARGCAPSTHAHRRCASLALMLTTRGSGRPHGSPSARWVMFARRSRRA